MDHIRSDAVRPLLARIGVSADIFEEQPQFERGIVIASDLSNDTADERLERILAETIDQRRTAPIDVDADERMRCWMDAHRRFGSNPRKHPPAHRALIRRIQRSPDLSMPFINRVVAIMNATSVKHVLPVGGDDLDSTGRDLILRRATGDESFEPLGKPGATESPRPGEVIYLDVTQANVLCRRWNWRNGHRTRITERSRTIAMNVDGLGRQTLEAVDEAVDDVASLLREFCGAKTAIFRITANCPSVEVPLR